jgi:hypothetical protein
MYHYDEPLVKHRNPAGVPTQLWYCTTYLVEGDGPLEGSVPDGQHDVVVARLLQQVVHLYNVPIRVTASVVKNFVSEKRTPQGLSVQIQILEENILKFVKFTRCSGWLSYPPIFTRNSQKGCDEVTRWRANCMHIHTFQKKPKISRRKVPLKIGRRT